MAPYIYFSGVPFLWKRLCPPCLHLKTCCGLSARPLGRSARPPFLFPSVRDPAGGIKLEIVCHSCFLSVSKDDFCCSSSPPTTAVRRRCQRRCVFKMKWGNKDPGRWRWGAGDGTEDQTAVEIAGNRGRRRRRRRGRLHTNAVLWILVSLSLLSAGVFNFKIPLHKRVSCTVLLPRITSILLRPWTTGLWLLLFRVVNILPRCQTDEAVCTAKA